jgi:hypothetical protein
LSECKLRPKLIHKIDSRSDISPDAQDFIRCLLCPDPVQRPTCEEALSHPWLNDRQNLEQRAAKKLAAEASGPDGKWSLGQHVAFSLSLVIILYSYIGLVTYVFNLGEASAAVAECARRELAGAVAFLAELLSDCFVSWARTLSGYTSLFCHADFSAFLYT